MLTVRWPALLQPAPSLPHVAGQSAGDPGHCCGDHLCSWAARRRGRISPGILRLQAGGQPGRRPGKLGGPGAAHRRQHPAASLSMLLDPYLHPPPFFVELICELEVGLVIINFVEILLGHSNVGSPHCFCSILQGSALLRVCTTSCHNRRSVDCLHLNSSHSTMAQS